MTTVARPRPLDEPRQRTRTERFFLGGADDPRWVRPALLGLLVATALLYLLGLGASGWGNAFYSAAAQAGSQSWQALLFGSSDAANSITVDKPPAALWVIGISVRIFGLNSWSALAAQAVEGLLTVGLLYATVRRAAGAAAGLLAGAVMALTPVAVLMFRFDNPDALLVLLLVAAYCVLRGCQEGRARWLPLAGTAVGFGFLTKMLQAFLVVPAFALVYLLAAAVPLRRRVLHVLAGAAALVVSAGWFVALVELWPASSRPYIGGSQHNSPLGLTFGYNGFGRLTGNETGGLGNTNADAGWTRLLGEEMGTQIGWLLPAAVLGLAAGLWLTRRAPRTDPARASLLLWGGWLVVTGIVFSFADGIVHAYYTVALAPAVAAVFAIGVTMLWRRRSAAAVRICLAGITAVTALVAAVLLGRASDWQPWLRIVVSLAGIAAAVLLLCAHRLTRVVLRAVSVVALVSALAAPAGYSVATAATSHTGAIPSAGPGGSAAGGHGPGGGGKPPGTAGAVTGNHGPGGAGGMAGLLGETMPSADVVSLLSADAASYTWVAATVGSNSAAGYQLATRDPVMALGGFNGTDPSPTLARFRPDVARHEIHYFVGGSLRRSSEEGTNEATRITRWVARHYSATTVDGVTLYDLDR